VSSSTKGSGDVAFEVGRGGVDEDHVAGQVQQRRRAIEDALRDLGKRVQEEVHGAIGRVLVKGGTAEERDALLGPVRRGELGARLETTVGDEREQHLLDHVAGEAPSLTDAHQRVGDTQPLPQCAQHVGAAETPGVHDLDLAARGRTNRLGGLQEPGDRRDEAGERLAVDLVGAAEVVDHLGDRRTRLGAALVVRELQVADG
jgi:hypothetical protein